MSIKKEEGLTLTFIMIVAFLFRFLYLGLKPPHFDEGINGWFVDQLINNGFYSYDPTNYHGPFHFYIIWLCKFIFGRNLWELRFSASLFGVASVYLIARLKTYLGTATSYIAAFFVAVSPGMVFYSRYGIHESELLFFSLVGLHGFFRFMTVKDKISLWLIGLGLTGMIVTKETFIVHVVCFAIAYVCLVIYEKFVPSVDLSVNLLGKSSKTKSSSFNPSYGVTDVYLLTGVCVLIFYLFYSGFLLHFQGVIDFFKSFAAWTSTGEKGNGHEKDIFYWIYPLFFHYEILGLAGLAATLRLLFASPRWLRLIGIYGVGVLLAYSIIKYKTPWCILNIVWPFYIMFASVLVEVGEYVRKRMSSPVSFRRGFALTILLLAIPLTVKSIQLNFYKYDDETEPYVYVQTFSDIMKIDEKIMNIVRIDPTFYYASIKLFMNSNWPIPWLLGDFTRVAYYGTYNDGDPNAAVILCDQQWATLLENKFNKAYFKMNFRLRSAQEPGVAYFDAALFKDQFAADAPRVEAKTAGPLIPGEGLLAEYFQNAEWTGKPVMKKIMIDPSFNLQDAQRPLPAPFGIIFSGEIQISKSGERTFYLDSDDGSDLTIDGKTIIENLGRHPEQMRSGSTMLKAGWHKIRVRYNDFGGGMILRLWWDNDSGLQQSIDSKFLRVPKNIIPPQEKTGGNP